MGVFVEYRGFRSANSRALFDWVSALEKAMSEALVDCDGDYVLNLSDFLELDDLSKTSFVEVVREGAEYSYVKTLRPVEVNDEGQRYYSVGKMIQVGFW